MGLNQTPSSERVHIGIFGKRNVGKSSVINAIVNQKLAIVSEVKGTTTDPVYKSMELLPLGPVVLIDTPGLDDVGELGALRVEKSEEVLRKVDLALLVLDASKGMSAEDQRLEERLRQRQIPCLLVYNKWDLCEGKEHRKGGGAQSEQTVYVSASTGEGIRELKERMAQLLPQPDREKHLVADLLKPLDLVVLVVPIDKAAPRGRLILPQQQTIRDVLEAGAASLVVRDTELKETLAALGREPRLVITDSQVFPKVAADTPEDILLTSFSILFARYKGNLRQAVEGVKALGTLQDGDKILIAEGCTHHRQCGDIGTEKLPRWIEEYTGKKPEFVFVSGTEFPKDLSEFHMAVHCGGCMLNEREMQYRLSCAGEQKLPMTNYGILIACMKGILKRSLQPFPEMADLL